MKVIFRVTECETVLLGLTPDAHVAQDLIVSDFGKDYAFFEELVKITLEGRQVYTARSKAEVIVDLFEYVDNDGNPITAEGEPLEDDSIVEDPQPTYDYDAEVLWIICDVEVNGSSGTPQFSSVDYFVPETDLLFEAHENFVVATH